MKAELICIVDRSGSMQSMKTDAEGGFNAMIEKQKQVEGELNVTLVQFDDEIETAYEGKPLTEVPALVINPRGATALLDAIGMTIVRQNDRIKEAANTYKVIVAIITDGKENCSREYKLDRVRELIKQAEDMNWEFIYLGANQDAFAEGHKMGLSASSQRHTQTYDSRNAASVRRMTDHLGATVTELRK